MMMFKRSLKSVGASIVSVDKGLAFNFVPLCLAFCKGPIPPPLHLTAVLIKVHISSTGVLVGVSDGLQHSGVKRMVNFATRLAKRLQEGAG